MYLHNKENHSPLYQIYRPSYSTLQLPKLDRHTRDKTIDKDNLSQSMTYPTEYHSWETYLMDISLIYPRTFDFVRLWYVNLLFLRDMLDIIVPHTYFNKTQTKSQADIGLHFRKEYSRIRGKYIIPPGPFNSSLSGDEAFVTKMHSTHICHKCFVAILRGANTRC